ncbi:venom allergen-1-like [Eurosta solidaginis]|uniref:venom allergen-1-like n=1 Tax=Eurosta solidaginis TaxID=178769 RepID=UPI0035317A14
MKFQFVFLTIFVATLELCTANDYCSPSLCNGLQHIACNNNGNFAARCTNPIMVNFTQAHKNIILARHNSIRNEVAGGQAKLPRMHKRRHQTKLKPACRMATMKWDNELARIAAFNVKQCQRKHDDCRNTNTFRQSGQNLVRTGTLNVPEMLHKAIKLWYNEISSVQMSQINSYPEGYISGIGRFTLMITDRNIRVGCAAATYKATATNMRSFLMACNYATTNIANRPIYKTCPTAASDCTTGTNIRYTNLCSTSESYSV